MWGGGALPKKYDPKKISTPDNFFPIELGNLGPYQFIEHSQLAFSTLWSFLQVSLTLIEGDF